MKNWKTTLIGYAGGLLYLFLGYLQGGLKPKDAALATAVALLGHAAKDRDQ